MSLLLSALLFSLPSLSVAQTLSLSDALAALPQSADWQSAELRFQSSQRALESAQAAAGLQVRGTGGYSYSAPEGGSGGSSNSLGLSASLSVLPWSPAQDQIRSAGRGLEGAALDLRDARAALALSLVSQYFAVRGATADLELAQAGEALATERLRVAAAQEAARQITREAFIQAQQALEQARLTRLQAQGGLENARITLYNALGRAPEAARLSTAPQALPMPPGTLEALIAQALERRGDVRKAQLQVDAAQDGLGIAQRDRWLPPASLSLGYGPRSQGGAAAGISLSGSLDLQSGAASVGLTQNGVNGGNSPSGVNTFTLGLQVSLPIVAPGADARVGGGQTALESARKALESARRAAELDVRQRHLEAGAATARLGVQRLALENANQAAATAQARRQAGLSTALDLSQAQLGARQAGRDLEAATAAQMAAVYRLLGAVGAFEQLPIALGGDQ